MAPPVIQISRLHAPAIVYFEAVRQHGSMRAAARALNVASPAVNRQILKIEDAIGAPLFERLPKGLRLTAVGEVFSRHTMTVMQDSVRTARELEGLFGIERGAISLIVAEGLVNGLLPSVLIDFQDRFPHVEIDVTTGGSRDMPPALIDGRADLAIAFNLEQSDELVLLASKDYPLGVLVARDHPLSARNTVGLRDCLDYPLTLAQGSLAIDELLAPHLALLGMRARVGLRTNSIELMRNMTLSGGHMMFASPLGFESDIAEGRLVHVPLNDGGGIAATLGVYARAGRMLPPAAKRFATAAGERLNESKAT